MSGPKETRDLYRESGVDIEKGDRLVDWLQQGADSAARPGGSVISGIGGFAGLFRPNLGGIKDPVLVASTDGVGTKLLLGIAHDKLGGLGQDLVGMCVNDLYCVGARPLFFLDYYATGKLSEAQFQAVLSGIRSALQLCDCALLGGETAELPGLYEHGHFDLAGFVVGVMDGSRTIGPDRVQEGDVVLSIESSGFHSNGYSLLRSWLVRYPEFIDETLIDRLLAPTKVYGFVPDMLHASIGVDVHAIAHITGGGLSGNLSRVIPDHLAACIVQSDLPTPEWMTQFVTKCGANFQDVERFFNMGTGLAMVVSAHSENQTLNWIRDKGFGVCRIGTITRRASEPVYYV